MKKFSLIAAIFVMIFTANVFAQGTWTAQTSPITTSINSAWAVNTDICWMCGPGGTSNSNVIRTTNGGTSWTLVSSSIPGSNDFYTICALDADNCWVGAGDGGLWHTTNGGTNWTFVTLSPGAVFINVVHFFDANYGFIQGDPVTNQWRYYITTNGGANWTLPPNTPSSVGSEAGWNNSYAALDTGHLWWGTNATKIWKGGLMGAFTSAPVGGANPNSFGVAFNDLNNGVATITTSAYATAVIAITTNGGTTWSNGSFTPVQTSYGLKAVPGTGYMWMSCGSTTAGTIYRSTNNGVAWVSQHTMTSAGYALTMANINCGWVGLANGQILKYTDNVGIGNPVTAPTKFELKQNYPNPFNPQTTIDFTLAQTGFVSLKIYNLMGQEVMTLIDGVETAGAHSVFFDASGLSSGTYFYAMKSGEFTDTKSMVLVK
jgi:hypothetical protein